MGLESDTRTIDDLEFTTQKLPARKAFALQNKILKLIAPAIGAFKASDVMAMDSMANMDISALGGAISKLFEELDEGSADKLILEILGSTMVKHNNKMVFLNSGALIDEVFTGRLMTMYKAMAYSVEWNFRDFFDAASGALAKLKEKQAAKEAAMKAPQSS